VIAAGAPGTELTRLARAGFAVLALGVLIMVAWVVLAPLSGAIIAPAFVKVDMNRKVVQHQEGGIVKQVLVRDGERVQQGQTLVVIDDVKLDATLDLLRTQHDGERAKAARLEAERAMLPEVKFPADMVERAREPKVVELIQRERRWTARSRCCASRSARPRTRPRRSTARSPPRRARSSRRRRSWP
jgi:epimerase transport system membrane fusion protein